MERVHTETCRREIKIGSVHGQFILSIGKRLTFSTSDSHDSLKPNITSKISPEENKKNYIHTVLLAAGHHVTVM